MKLRVLIFLAIISVLAARSSHYLVINDPKRSDIILVLAGETEKRPERGLELLRQDYGSKLILDVPVSPRFYGSSQADLAQGFIDALPEAKQISLCPITGLSTKAETQDAAACLKNVGGRSVLLVTSDFHTRRALSTFERELPAFQFSVAASFDPRQFGLSWWTNRQWAKVNFEEWLRLTWWQCVDRWR